MDTRTGRTAIAGLARRYPMVAIALAAGAAAGIADLAGAALPAHIVLGALGAAVVAMEARNIVGDIRSGHWGLDILAISAIVATVVLGEFWAAFIVSVMVVGGEALEDYATARARQQVSALMNRIPVRAHRIVRGAESEISVDQVGIGDELRVRAGEVVPVDGVLVDTIAEFDESSLTGESLPVSRSGGDMVASGSVAAGSAVTIKAVALASDSQFQRIVAMVDEAASVRGRFIRIADRLAIPFTMVAYLLAAAAWIISGDAIRFAEVLVVATPCPLLVAAPTALVAGMGRAAKQGVVVKSGESMERLASIRSAAFDKTGTLTRGFPTVERTEATGTFDAVTVFGVAASLERSSAHVLATAIVAAAGARGTATRVTQVRETTGQGLRGRWDGRDVVIGKAAFVAEHTRPFTPAPLNAGELGVYVGIGGEPAGRLVMRDEVRGDAAEVISRLRALGLQRVMMLTGDGRDNAERVGREVGIDDIEAGLMPADKVAAVADLVPRPVMMVGDGVNDAPVLAAADIGVAMGARGATAASESADVVLLVDELGRLPLAVGTARRTMTIARQSVLVGIGLSLVLMGVATFGVIPAVIGAVAQEVIDVVTILNGLRAGRPIRASADEPVVAE